MKKKNIGLVGLLAAVLLVVSSCSQQPQKVAEKAPQEPATLAAAIKHMDEKNFKASKQMLNKIVKEMPKDWKAVQPGEAEIGIVYWDDTYASVCASIDEKALGKKIKVLPGPSYSRAYFMLGYIATEDRSPVDANNFLDMALKLEPNHPDILTEKAGVMTDGKNLQARFNIFKKVAEMKTCVSNSTRARAMRGAGVTLIDMNELDEAAKVLYQSLKLDPNNRIALNELKYIDSLRNGESKKPLQIVSPEPKK